MGDSIIIPTQQGLVMATVDQFWDSLYDWFAMPFYEAVHSQNMPYPFCLIIHAFPEQADPSCPNIAYGTDDPLPNKKGAWLGKIGIGESFSTDDPSK